MLSRCRSASCIFGRQVFEPSAPPTCLPWSPLLRRQCSGIPLRRITPREAARLQGLPDSFEFPGQPDMLTYKQLGNGVNAGVVFHVAREQMLRSGAEWEDIAAASSSNAFAW